MRKDPDRLAELKRLLILDSTPEHAYDDITRLLATTFDVPITIVNLLDADRDWFKACVGLLHHQSPSETSFCESFFHTGANVIVSEDTMLDDRFANHALVAGPPFIRFYAAARLSVAGQTIGTLCAYDVRPRTVSAEQLDCLMLLAESAIRLFDERVRAPA